jgi:psiF repeat
MFKQTIVAAVLSLAFVTVSAYAQSPTPSATDKKAISKACTEQADAKNLHGKARKKFRSDCKAHGGKPSGT